VWSRVGTVDDGGLPFRREAGEQDGRLHLCARDRQLVVDRLEQRALDHERRMTVGRLDARAHAAQRLADALHRARRQRLVAGQLEAPRPACKQTGEESHQRPRVRAVDRARTQLTSVDEKLVLGEVFDRDAERADRVDARLRVAGAAEAEHVRVAFRDRTEENRTVRDRLVAGHGDVPDERGGRIDPHGG